MSFIRTKEIPPGSGNFYSYRQTSKRVDGKVTTVFLGYIGKASGGGTDTASATKHSPVKHSLGITRVDKINSPNPLTNSSDIGIVKSNKGEEKKEMLTEIQKYHGVLTDRGEKEYRSEEYTVINAEKMMPRDVVRGRIIEAARGDTLIRIQVVRSRHYPASNWINFHISDPKNLELSGGEKRRTLLEANVASFGYNVSERRWAGGRVLTEYMTKIVFPDGLPSE